jgi:DNA-binding response OmpR family regulator
MTHIIVAEDELLLLKAVCDLLSIKGYEVQPASSGDAVLEILQNSDNSLPALIISDVMMPGMNGLELLQEMRANDAWASIPFMFMSASVVLDYDETGPKLAGVSALVKPFGAQALYEAVDMILNREQKCN